MNTLTSFASALSRFTKAATPDPAPSAPPVAPPSPTPEPSCFVKGLIHSMKTEPEKWVETSGCIYAISYKHSESGAVLWRHNNCRPIISVYVSGVKTTSEEEVGLARALIAYIIEPPKIKARKEIDEKNSAIRAHFEKLGCPDKSNRP